ncbi:hypothetical protein K8I28_00700 [bacterium]|nr:hypothetical protein [bacterium]
MRAKFGEMVVSMGFVSQEKLDEAIEMQRKGRTNIGTVMHHLNFLTEAQVEKVVQVQASDESKGHRFGEIAMGLGFLDDSQLEQAVRYQRNSKAVLGDLLIELGYLTSMQRNEVIREQIAG